MRLLQAHALQQQPAPPFTCFNSTGTMGTLLTLVPYFVGPRSAACPGHLWLSSRLFCLFLFSILTFTATLIQFVSFLPRLPVCFSLFSSPCLPSLYAHHIVQAEDVYYDHCLSVGGSPAAPQNPGALKFFLYPSVLPVSLARAQHRCRGSG